MFADRVSAAANIEIQFDQHQLKNHSDRVNSIAVLSDGKRVNPVQHRVDYMIADIRGRSIALYVMSGFLPLIFWAAHRVRQKKMGGVPKNPVSSSYRNPIVWWLWGVIFCG